TTELAELMDQAKALEEDEYTESTYDALQKAIEQAEDLMKNASSQEEITEATELLQTAMDNLEKIKNPKPEVDTTELKELIKEAKTYKEDAYTKKSYTALQNEITHAEKVIKDANEQDEVDESILALQHVIDELVKANQEQDSAPETKEEKPEKEDD